jgi:histone H2A
MAGGKGKSIGGKGAPGKDAAGKTQKSHSAKAGLQVSLFCSFYGDGF